MVDITELILDDHREQRRLFAILEQIDRAETDVLSAIWDRLAAFLELHAKAEEEIFYPELLQVGIAARRADRVEDETLDAIHDHNEIRDAVAAVAQHQVGTDDWYAAVAAANLANSDHMAEEEREGLTDFRRLAGLSRRHRLAVAFAAYEARNYAGVEAVDEDPAGYIREVENKLPTESEPSTEDQPPATENKPAPSNGSLSVGSLKRN
ncbi:hemerythrin domain-containing protein [Nocardia suismassiliense]|uniref:Hemerythrin domain-containing protein n=1 Tax=Nocardia suismassiliense TaxID=2077092 RepID=A0ABW6R4Z0_9NOCA